MERRVTKSKKFRHLIFDYQLVDGYQKCTSVTRVQQFLWWLIIKELNKAI